MSHSFAPSIIRIILQKEAAQDDVLTISPVHNKKSYNVKFTQNTIQNVYDFNIPSADLEVYLRNFMRNIAFDANPCNYIQVEFPGMPCVIVPQKQTEFYLQQFLEQLEFTQKTVWPEEKLIPV